MIDLEQIRALVDAAPADARAPVATFTRGALQQLLLELTTGRAALAELAHSHQVPR